MTGITMGALCGKIFGFAKAAGLAIKATATAVATAAMALTLPQALSIAVCAGAVVGTAILVVGTFKHIKKCANKSNNVTECIVRKGQENKGKKNKISKVLREIQMELDEESEFPDKKDIEILKGRRDGRFHKFFMKNKDKKDSNHDDWFYNESEEEKSKWAKTLHSFKENGYII